MQTMQGYLTYTSILASVLFTVFGTWFSKDETEVLASAILTLVSLGVAAYGRYRREQR